MTSDSAPADPHPTDSQPNDSQPNDGSRVDLSEQRSVRLAKREQLLASGVQPYPAHVDVDATLAEVRRRHPALADGEGSGDVVGVAARVVFARNTGKLCFATLQSGEGTRLQAMVSAAEVGPDSLAEWKRDVDLGDHVWVHGEVVSSRRGELSVMVDRWAMASKALRPLPTLHHDLSEETRVRQRYADLIVRPEARRMVRMRAAVLRSLRETLHAQDYLEVETPLLQSMHGGAAARPFATHLNAFDMPMYLRIAIELYLKRAVVGGVERVYEIGRIFRNEGVDSTHSPEFTMLEAYQAYGDQESMAQLTRTLVLDAARAVGVTEVSDNHGGTIDLEAPWHRLTVHQAVSRHLGEDITVDTPAARLHELADQHEVPVDGGADAGVVLLALFDKLVEHTLLEPTFVGDFPVSAAPLCRPHREDPRLTEGWDLIIGGVELVTAFTELVDPVVQRQRLVEQARLAAAGDDEAMSLDEDFLRALEYGMPPTGGLGLGVDRLIMLLSGAGIRETILFPMLRPE